MIVDWGLYADGQRVPDARDVAEAIRSCTDDGTFVWLGLHDPSPDELEAMQHKFGLHDLAIEDVALGRQRPKLEIYDDTVFVVAKPATYVDDDEEVVLGEIHLFIGAHFVLAVRRGKASPLKGARARLESQPELLARGPGAVLHAVLDRVVDDYLPVIRGLQNDIDEIERAVFATEHPDPVTHKTKHGAQSVNPVQRIYQLKREVIDFHHAAASLLDPLEVLSREKVPHVAPGPAGVLPRRPRPPDPLRRAGRGLRRAVVQRADRAPHRGLDPAEQRHAQDLCVGRDRGGPHDDRGHLRHELRAHARAGAPAGATRS